jgi:hypothetical protein
MKVYFTKGVNIRYPNRWYLSADPYAQCVQSWPWTDVVRARLYIENLGFQPCIKRYLEKKLFISFRNKSDEAWFVIQIADGFEI